MEDPVPEEIVRISREEDYLLRAVLTMLRPIFGGSPGFAVLIKIANGLSSGLSVRQEGV